MKETVFNSVRKLAYSFQGLGLSRTFVGNYLRKVFVKNKPDFVDVKEGFRVFIHKGKEYCSDYLILNKVWDLDEIKILKRVLKKGDVFVDVGANLGYYSCVASKLVKKEGEVYAIEPFTKNCELIEKTIKYNNFKNIQLIKKALSNKIHNKQKFYIYEEDYGGCSLIDSVGKNFEYVNVVTFDSLFEDKKVDFVKIDTEGTEYFVLLGMKKTIINNPSIKILMEFAPFSFQTVDYPEKSIKLLESWGFSFYDVQRKEKTDVPTLLKEYNKSEIDLKVRVKKGLFTTTNLYCYKGVLNKIFI